MSDEANCGTSSGRLDPRDHPSLAFMPPEGAPLVPHGGTPSRHRGLNWGGSAVSDDLPRSFNGPANVWILRGRSKKR